MYFRITPFECGWKTVTFILQNFCGVTGVGTVYHRQSVPLVRVSVTEPRILKDSPWTPAGVHRPSTGLWQESIRSLHGVHMDFIK
jgi:hypothetical protein